MTISLSSKVSNDFIPLLTSGYIQLSSGASGTIITLTPPSGQKVRLISLLTSGSGQETGVTVQVGGVDAVDSKILCGTTSNITDGFKISPGIDATHGDKEAASVIPSITGKIDEAITVIKDSGSTAVDFFYSYQFGV